MLKYLLLYTFLPFLAYSQSIIEGTVLSKESGKAIEGVVVQCFSGSDLLAYSISGDKGEYKLEVESVATELTLTFEHLTCQAYSFMVGNRSQKLKTELESKSLSIKEVVVSAPKLVMRGDTLTYNLGAFKGEGDVTLEDAMKNLPGVDVKESGAIEYLGKSISNFYIEDLDLLGGKYGVATRNIKADMVAKVELIENHQPVKMLKNKTLTDNVAVNVILKKSAKIKPVYSYEGALGGVSDRTANYDSSDGINDGLNINASSGANILYKLGLTGMVFMPNFQTISTVKFGNMESSSSRDLANLTNWRTATNNVSLSILSNLSGSKPPLKESRYLSVLDGTVSINSIKKLANDVEFKVNLDYSYNRNSYSYNSVSSYYTGDSESLSAEDISSNSIFIEANSPLSVTHKPTLSLDINRNNSKIYIRNSFWASATIINQESPIVGSLYNIEQSREAFAYDINNDFRYKKLVGEKIWGVTSKISYVATPSNSITYNFLGDDESSIIQNSQGRALYVENTFDFSFEMGDYIKVFMPLSLDLSYDNINTAMSGGEAGDLYAVDGAVNALSGIELTPSLSPRAEYISANRRVEASLSFPINYSMLSYNGGNFYYNRVVGAPSFNLDYTLSPSSKLKLNANAGNRVGDVTDFLVAPIQTSYRTTSIKSGVLSESVVAQTSIGYEFKMPLDYLFMNASVGYNYLKRNLLTSQSITDSSVVSSSLLSDNISQGFSSSFFISKLFNVINTKFNIGAKYNWNRGFIEQQSTLTEYIQQLYSVSGDITSKPWKWMEINYSIDKSWNSSEYYGIKSRLTADSHLAKLSVFPNKRLKVFTAIEYINNEVAASNYVSMALFDVGASYKFKKFELELALNNLLNTKSYSYTVFSGLDSFSYNYALRGREIVLSIKWF